MININLALLIADKNGKISLSPEARENRITKFLTAS
jgi:hypothetical protein